jgi:hypothetical protein
VTGNNNTANGFEALFSNTTGSFNTASGFSALNGNTTGTLNTATGVQALQSNTTGSFNTASGFSALNGNTTGTLNTASGLAALYQNTTGFNNTASGFAALFNNTTGHGNIAFGVSAGANLTTGSNNIDIGNVGVGGESATIRIGTVETHTATFIAGISGTAVVGEAVVVDRNGQLGTVASAARFKKEIRPIDKSSESILALKPVTFCYKSDDTNTPQFGLIAEEVAEVNPDLVVGDKNGEIYTVRYDAVNAMLLNEFLKEHRKVQELEAIAAKQEATAAQQQRQIEALTAGLQKVSAQLELSKPGAQTVVNNQ